MIERERVRELNQRPVRAGKYVLCWMQASQRTRFNHGLEWAIERANELALPVVAGFGLMDDYPEANARHYAFMLQGLADVKRNLGRRGIQLVVKRGQPAQAIMRLTKDAALVVCDRGYLRHQKRWRDVVAERAGCRVVQAESDVVVPVDEASTKAEFAARTIRPKIHQKLDRYLKPIHSTKVKAKSVGMRLESDLDVKDWEAALAKLKVDRSVEPSSQLEGGEEAARKRLRDFVKTRLAGYAKRRRQPGDGATSTMSAYLHFGQISPVEIALAVRDADAPEADRQAYVEELIVRRELAINWVEKQPRYDEFAALPAWARKTLAEHARDPRETGYSLKELEEAKTGDRYWNSAHLEMKRTGFMHNTLRMYWGKKILEWSPSPEEAFTRTLYLNNKYLIDGRDPNSYANVGWIFGLHDRPWRERKIFGTVRCMTAAGLEKKFDMERYVEWVASL